MHVTGDLDGIPQKVGFAVTDILTGQQLTNGIIAAILHRERTGEGQLVETNLLQASLYASTYVASAYLNGNYDYPR